MGKTKRLYTFLPRLLALMATVAAAAVMATSHQTTEVFGISIEAKYTHTPSFKYFVVANGIASVYSLLVLFLPPESLLWRLVVAIDVVITMLLTSSTSAALAIAYVGKKGNSHAGWQPICGQVPKYCHHVSGALAAGFVGVLIYGLLVLSSIQNFLNPLLLQKS
ncbi:hypothetical protein Ancab_007805 [Ancistrocladus abbreviatus]